MTIKLKLLVQSQSGDQEESLLVAVLQPNKIGANPFLLHLSYSQPNRNTTQKQIRNPGGWSLCQHLMSGTFRFVSNQQDGTCANSRARIKPDTFPGKYRKDGRRQTQTVIRNTEVSHRKCSRDVPGNVQICQQLPTTLCTRAQRQPLCRVGPAIHREGQSGAKRWTLALDE